MFEVEIQPLSIADADAVVLLAGQLGYDLSVRNVRDWLSVSDDGRVALAARIDGDVVGWIQAHDLDLLQYPRVLEIGALVVDEQARGRGIGKLLVDAVAEWGRERSHTEIRVRSNVIRDGAHAFYEGLGFTRAKTSYTFSIEIE
jgi:GNAT superfamily N-acetyltransferase